MDGTAAVESCLAALAAQDTRHELEIIVPWDESIAAVGALARRFPSVRFVSMGRLQTSQELTSEAGQHELFDRRRAAGLAVATGDVIAILEDRGRPRPDWARMMISAHQLLPHAVIGGAIENAHDSPLNWAVYFCDFGRYQPPFEPGPRQWVSDINIGYKRTPLMAVVDAWREEYREATVNWALLRNGEVLYVTPDAVVEQCRGDLSFRSLLSERVAWGRLFALTRAREHGLLRRFTWAVTAPLLPVLLFARQLRLQCAKRTTLRPFLLASPIVVCFLAAWSVGEALGYLHSEY